MKSTKVLALIIGVISLFPSVCKAENISGTNIETNLNSSVTGIGNVSQTTTKQSIINRQKHGETGLNIHGVSSVINANTILNGVDNVDVKRAEHKYGSRQK
jgi:hypothetical protein